MKPLEVVAAIIERNNTFLIAKRKRDAHLSGKWEFPGGKIEPGETPEECLVRELKEEFDIEVSIKNYVGENTFTYDDLTIHLAGYRVKHVSGEFQLNDHEEIRWVTISELDQYDFAGADIPFVEQLKSTCAGNDS